MISSNIRVPEDLWEKLKIQADKDKRSLNSEILYIIERFIEEKEATREKVSIG